MTNAPVAGGYILLARRLFESEMMDKPPLYFKLWGWMLARAMWKDGGKLKRGQLVTSISEMQQAMSYRVGWRRVVPTKDEIRSAYEAFTKATMITTRKTTRGMVVTVLNYGLYQDPESYEAHTRTAQLCENSEDTYETLKKPTRKATRKPTHSNTITACNDDDFDNVRTQEAHKEAHDEAPRKPTDTPHDREEFKKKRNKFSIPSLDEVRAYCLERGNDVDPEKWMNHYEAKGWLIGKTPMRDWRAAVRTWEKSSSPKGGAAVVDLGYMR
ncbi:hypothetical protein [Geobacter benzoatilyticus]|uniref:Replication protein n=1 Tax=Geobacter benzoatilyticus TaxID=2815309 RepID=A0ABX7Q1R5_9BACT|nr:hypothetical protein [Geobacter benzoatilyticus]QSV45010.1 hypothetical protein JZM60_12740 [Geobacter benzoatilyticus]